MHEFSICERIVSAALTEAELLEPPPERIRGIDVVIGGLHQIVPEYLQTAYEVLTKDTLLDGSKMILRTLPVTVKCKQCNWTGTIELPVFACGDCGAFRVDVTGGRELYLDRMEVEDYAVPGN